MENPIGKVAITGAGGHIGMAIMEELDRRKIAYKVLIRSNEEFFRARGTEFVRGSINDPQTVAELLDGCDALIHCAALISINGDKHGLVHKTNVEGVRTIMQAALDKKLRRVLHISSIHAYNPYPRHEALDEQRDFVNDRAFAYDRSKRDGQRVVQEFVAKGLPAIILNPTSVIGPPELKLSLQGKAIRDIYLGRIPAIFRGGFDWVDVRDVVTAICNALNMGKVGESYLLSGTYHSLKEIVQMVSDIKGRRIRTLTVPAWTAKAGLPFVALQSKISGRPPLYTMESIEILQHSNMRVNNNKARKDLLFNPRTCPETLRDLVAHLKELGEIKN
ncbi:MAG: NAD-dependent epimerase/dehydratase family protein [Flavobacteriales bacterium]